MVIGIFTQNEWYNFLGSFIGRVAGVLFITALYNKFPWWVGIPIMLSLAAVVYDNDNLYWTSMVAHMTVYRITAYKTFTELNRKNGISDIPQQNKTSISL